MDTRNVRRSRIAAMGIGGAAVVVLTLSIAVFAPKLIRGPRFGRLVERSLPPTCGRIHVGGGTWTWGTALALLRGRPAPLVLTDVVVADPTGTEVLRVRQLSGGLELSRDRLHVTIHDLRIEGAFWRFAQIQTDGRKGVGFLMAFEPAGDGPRRCGARSTARGARPGQGSFRIANAEIDGLDVVFDLPGWALSLKDVRTAGSLEVPNQGAAGGDVGFEVSGADVRGGGQLGVLDGAARLELPFSHASLRRVATTRARPDAIVIEASGVTTGKSTLALSGAFTSVLDSRGPRRAPGIDLRAQIVDAADAVQTVVARRAGGTLVVGSRRVGAGAGARAGAGAGTGTGVTAEAGAGAGLAMTFLGPFDKIGLDVRARGFDVKYHGVDLLDVGFHLSVEPPVESFAGRLQLSNLSITSPGGGRVGVDAKIEELAASGTVVFDHFVTSPLFPTLLLPLVGGTLDGSIRGRVDLAAASAFADEVAITLTRPPGVSGPRVVRIAATNRTRGAGETKPGRRSALSLRMSGARFVDGTFYLPRVASSLWGGRLAASGKIAIWDRGQGSWKPAPVFDLTLKGDRVLVQRLTGVGFINGAISFQARAQGPLEKLDLRIGFPRRQILQVVGQPFVLPAALALRLNQDDLLIPEIQLVGAAGGTLTTAGKIGLSGRLDFGVGVREFPLGKLPGLAETALPFGGRLTGQLRLSGDSGRPVVTGQLSVEDVTLAGYQLGVGSLVITPGPEGAIRASGRLGEDVTARGILMPGPAGLRGEATLELHHLRLDPFFSALPGGVTASGVVSGSATARIAPGRQPSIAGSLTELLLTVTGPRTGSAAVPASRAVELRAVGDVPLSAEAAGGPIRIGPARFTGNAGSFEIKGETEGDKERGTLRGRIDLATLAPVLRPWLESVSGAVDFDLAVASQGSLGGAGARPRPLLTGKIGIATPVSVRPVDAPLGVQFPSGRFDFAGDRVSTGNLLATLGRGTIRVSGGLVQPTKGAARIAIDLQGDLDARLAKSLAPEIVGRAEGTALVNAHVGGTVAEPKVKVRVDLSRGVDFVVPALGPDRIHLVGGPIELDGRAVTVRSLEADVGPRVRMLIGADGIPGTVLFPSLSFDEIGQLDLPLRGRVTGLSMPAAEVDRATFTLRLSGDPRRRLRLAGDVDLEAVRVSSQALATSGAPRPAPGTAWLSRPEAERTDLDVHVRALGGALVVNVPYAPDPHLNIDFHIRGTVKHPVSSGQIKPSGVYSFFALLAYRLFR